VTDPAWKRVLLCLMYAEMPHAWIWYLALVEVGAVLAPCTTLRVLLVVAAFLILAYRVPPGATSRRLSPRRPHRRRPHRR
jgi:hypothetical protein